MAELPIIYTVRLDLSPEVKDEFNAWAGAKHIDDLLSAGFLSAIRFKASIGQPEYLHVYELPDVGLMQTEKYQNVSRNDTSTARLHHGILNHSASLYEQVVAVNVPETPRSFPNPRTTSVGGVTNRDLITVQMDVEAGREEELVKWHREEHIPALLEAKGMVTGRLCRRVAKHPKTPCLDPEWVAIYEMESAETLDDPKVKAANETEWAKRMHGTTTDVRFCVLERITPS